MTIHEVKISLGRRVSYNGSDCYELTGCIIRKSSKTGQFFYQAEIADNAISDIIAATADGRRFRLIFLPDIAPSTTIAVAL